MFFIRAYYALPAPLIFARTNAIIITQRKICYSKERDTKLHKTKAENMTAGKTHSTTSHKKSFIRLYFISNKKISGTGKCR